MIPRDAHMLPGRRPDYSEDEIAEARPVGGFVSGQWRALNDVLAYLNTLEDKVVRKSDVFRFVMDMRPSPSPMFPEGDRSGVIDECIAVLRMRLTEEPEPSGSAGHDNALIDSLIGDLSLLKGLPPDV